MALFPGLSTTPCGIQWHHWVHVQAPSPHVSGVAAGTGLGSICMQVAAASMSLQKAPASRLRKSLLPRQTLELLLPSGPIREIQLAHDQ